MKELIGKKILRIVRKGDYLGFVTDAGDFSYRTEGDCCSSSWFEHFEGIGNLIGHTVNAVENVEIDKVFPEQIITRDGWTHSAQVDDHGEEHECLQLYGIKLATEHGTALIEFRNSSNGYYGGGIEYIGEGLPSGALDLFEDF